MFGRADVKNDVAFFEANRLDADAVAYKREKPIPAADRPPTPVNWIDNLFQTRTLSRPQPHNEAARRWLSTLDAGESASTIPDPAHCLLAIREARTALAAKPDDRESFRLLAAAYRTLMTQEAALLAGIALTPENLSRARAWNRAPIAFRSASANASPPFPMRSKPRRRRAASKSGMSCNRSISNCFNCSCRSSSSTSPVIASRPRSTR